MPSLPVAPRPAFLSTLSLRRATRPRHTGARAWKYFYPRSPCGERPPCPSWARRTGRNFYPRSPCGERRGPSRTSPCVVIFLSTLSLRRATAPGLARLASYVNFYPRSPCGERPPQAFPFAACVISIHALLAESDSHTFNLTRFQCYFYPRSPCGERPSWCRTRFIASTFLSTLSLRRATSRAPSTFGPTRFLSTLSLRRATGP